MVRIIFDYQFYQQSYASLKSKNVVKFCVHISPIFSCPVTNYMEIITSDILYNFLSQNKPNYIITKLGDQLFYFL